MSGRTNSSSFSSASAALSSMADDNALLMREYNAPVSAMSSSCDDISSARLP